MSGSNADRGRSEATVGRREERTCLHAALVQASQSRPRIVVLEGDAGIGKSHLLRELVATARARGFSIGTGHALENGAVPYRMLRDAVQTLMQGCPAVRDRLGEKCLDPTGPLDWDALMTSLVEAGRAVPLLLALDDLHWADEESLQILMRLAFALSDAAPPGGVSVLLALATRPILPEATQSHGLRRLSREPVCEWVELRGLDLLDTTELLRVSGLPLPEPRTVQGLHEGAQGNPLFIKGLVARALRDHPEPLAAALDPARAPLPHDLAAVVAAQIARADALSLSLLRRAALFGQRFSLELLASVAGRDLEVVVDALARWPELVALRGDDAEIAHPLIRQTLIQRTPTALRQQLHASIVQALDARVRAGDADAQGLHVVERAHHALAAGDWVLAEERLRAFKRAAEQLRASLAFSSAAQLYAAAAELESEIVERGELHFLAASCHQRSYDRDSSVRHYDAALSIFEKLNDDSAAARILGERARLDLYSVALAKMRDVTPLQAVLRRLSGKNDPNEGWLHCALGDAYFYGRRPADGERHAQRALEIGELHEDPLLCRAACVSLGLSQGQAMRYVDSERTYAIGVQHSLAAGEVALATGPRVRHAIALQILGRLGDARAECETAVSVALRASDAGELAMAFALLCSLDAASGRFAEAGERALQMLRWLGRADARPWTAILGVPAYAYVRVMLGETSDALVALAALTEKNRFVPRVGRSEHIYKNVLGHWVAADAGAPRDDDAGRARRAEVELYARGVDPERIDGMGLLVVCALCELCLHYQLPIEVEAPRAAVQRAFDRGARFATGWPFLLPRVLGNVEATFGDRGRAFDYYRVAVDVATASGARAELARTQLDWARALVADSAPAARRQARNLLQPALDTMLELQMTGVLSRALGLAETLGLRPPPLSAEPEISPIDVRLVHQLLSSESPGEIADRHLLSPLTLRERAGRVFDRLGVRGPLELLPHAVARGLVPAPSVQPGVPLALLVTDLQAFTPLVERLGDYSAQQLIREHNALLRARIRDHGGVEVTHTGDGILAAFRSVPESVSCAAAIQRSVARRNATTQLPAFHVRIGLHAGEPLLEEGRLFGSCVITAVRICSTCEPDRILVSSRVQSSAPDSGYAFAPRGVHYLKGFTEPIDLFEIAWRDDAALPDKETSVP